MVDIRKKTWPDFFQKIVSGEKKFDVRLADFECDPGDVLVLEEWDPETKQYTGRKIRKKVTYIARTKNFPYWTEEEIEKHGYLIMQMADEEKK